MMTDQTDQKGEDGPQVTTSKALQYDDGSNSTHGNGTSSPEEGSSTTPNKPSAPPAPLRKRDRRPTIPDFLKPRRKVSTFAGKVGNVIAQEANFYRIHVTVFTLTPLIFASIFYASNTTPIAFIDCLFVCVSAMTVTGLTTINISIITPWQQAILFFLMTIGNLSAVSIIMVLIRRHFFKLKFDDVIKRSSKARKKMKDVEEAHQREKHRDHIRLQKLMGFGRSHANDTEDGTDAQDGGVGTPHSSDSSDEAHDADMKKAKEAKKKKDRKKQGPLRADMIRRIDEPAVLINSAGMPSRAVRDRSQDEGSTTGNGGILASPVDDAVEPNSDRRSLSPDNIRFALPDRSQTLSRRSGSIVVQSPEEIKEEPNGLLSQDSIAREGSGSISARSGEPMRARFDEGIPHRRDRSGSDPTTRLGHPRRSSDVPALPSATAPRPTADAFPRTQTIEFSEPFRAPHRRLDRTARTTALPNSGTGAEGLRHRSHTLDFDRTPTMATTRSGTSRRLTGVPIQRAPTSAKERGFGGFPTPIEIAGHAVQKAFPKLQKQFTRTTTMARTSTFTSVHSASGGDPTARHAPYLTFDATVSRNSRFHELTQAQRDELGGVEYRAIDLLAKLLPAYWLIFNLFFITLVAPWLASRSAVRVRDVLATQGESAPHTTWMWFFQVISAYSNTGLSLIDTSMINLADQYLMLIPMAILILAGNTAFPIFLRFFIWCISLVAPKDGRLYETLRFLLDHPRRCFVYLFPSGQTWFLFVVLIILNCTDWVFFQVLDIGNATIESWSVGQRIFDGLFQSIAVRAAGFQIISVLTLAPAVQFLYIVMMYISAYPIAMSVRNTNVYEERSLGVYNEEPGNAVEPDNSGGARVWGNYLAAHARRQLAFDIWWLGFALWLVCIIERRPIQDATTDGWFTVFNCLFELTSAYGTVGLSTGTPFDNFSLAGRFTTLGKLVVIVVMLRGRHRGLPVAIDRAVLLPGDMEFEDDAQNEEDEFIRSRTMMTGSISGTFFPRSTTAMTGPQTPRMTPGMSPGQFDRDQRSSVPDLDDDGMDGEQGSGGKEATLEGTTHHPSHFSHLAAIQEFSPSQTPMPTKRVDDYMHDQRRDSPLVMTPRTSEERERKREFFGGAKIEQLPSAVETFRSDEDEAKAEENRLNEINRRYQEKYGSSE